ncbi:MAG: hypothetical protein K9M07_05990 [Simkaniaceae bacterium]|nr:hypothetical protein [Simkaniaceae bacterium]MCF7852772.1 hypothetical protein [Simkaniaceae bacterium]
MKSAYLAAKGFEKQLQDELNESNVIYDRLYISNHPFKQMMWALNCWKNPQLFSFQSIGEAARHLKSIQRNWALFPYQAFRRSKLIEEKLPFISQKPLSFPAEAFRAPLGSWTLLDENTLLYSATCTSPFPNGEPLFVENKKEPPSRAYLKLYEALSLLGDYPKPHDRCLEIGAAPGSWTWVLSNLKAHVIAYDRAPLDELIMTRKNVYFHQGDAFAALPESIGPVDWIFSDIICYPDRLYDWVQQWRMSGLCKRFVVTLKLQEGYTQDSIDRFRQIPHSTVQHLFHNKHELTWISKP